MKRKRCISEDRFTNEDSFEDEEEDTETCVSDDDEPEEIIEIKEKPTNDNLCR